MPENLKRAAVERSLDYGPMKSALEKKDSSAQKLYCQLNHKYVLGVDHIEESLMIGGFAFGGLAGALSRIGLMMKGEKLLSLGQKTLQTGKMMSTIGIGSGIAFDVKLIQKQCFDHSNLLLSQASCLSDAQKISENENKLHESRNCFLTAAFAAIPVSFMLANPVLKVYVEQRRSYLRAANEVGSKKASAVLPHEIYQGTSQMHDLFVSEDIVASSRETKNFIKQNQIDAKPISSRIVPVDPEREKRCLDRIQKLQNILKLKTEKIKKDIKEGKITSEAQLEEAKKSELSKTLEYLNDEHKKLELARNGYVVRINSKLADKIRTKDELEIYLAERNKGNVDVFLLQSAPSPVAMPKLSTSFLFHPLFKERFEKLKQMGVEIVLDSQLAHAANYNPKTKTISINPVDRFDYLEHEYTHAIFDHYVSSRIMNNQDVLREEIINGAKLKDVLKAEGVKELGEKKIEYLEQLIKKFQNRLTLDESLATFAQIQKIGWRPVSSEFYFPKWYGAKFRVAELTEKLKYGPLPLETQKELNAQLMELAVNYKIYGSILGVKQNWNQQLQEIAQHLKNGNASIALSLANSFVEQVVPPKSAEANLFINEKGEIIKYSKERKTGKELFEYY